LVAHQRDPQRSGGALDVAAWLAALGRLHAFVAPLVATKLDDVPLHLASRQQEAQLQQLAVLEGQVQLARRAAGQTDAEGKRASARLRSENEALLEGAAELKRRLHRQEAVEKQLHVEAAGLRAELRKLQGPGARGQPWLGGGGGGGGGGGSGSASGAAAAAHATGAAGHALAGNLLPAESYRRVNPLAEAQQSANLFRAGAASATPPRDPQAAGGRGLAVPAPAPRDKQLRAVSSAMVPSNLARAATLKAVSTALRHHERAATLERVSQLEQSRAAAVAALQEQRRALAALEAGALHELLGGAGARAAVQAALCAAAAPRATPTAAQASPGGTLGPGGGGGRSGAGSGSREDPGQQFTGGHASGSVVSLDGSGLGSGLGDGLNGDDLSGEDPDRGDALAAARHSLSAGGSGGTVHFPALPRIG
jgi:hypothetical protein